MCLIPLFTLGVDFSSHQNLNSFFDLSFASQQSTFYLSHISRTEWDATKGNRCQDKNVKIIWGFASVNFIQPKKWEILNKGGNIFCKNYFGSINISYYLAKIFLRICSFHSSLSDWVQFHPTSGLAPDLILRVCRINWTKLKFLNKNKSLCDLYWHMHNAGLLSDLTPPPLQ